ncbi:hypothetical protein BN1180_00269 [Peribacillus simplex]|uniref:Uncharacterized protein n=1 Tax=Peribacillus simplex TaxID=1478 RepID=A0AAN2PCQ3_9BACI|nr:hypothetical protein BN1180_00269 [Peribacillus simplex]
MASKPFQRSFGGWFDISKDRKRSSWRNINGAAVAAPSISLIGSFNFHVPLFLLNDEKRMVIAMIDHDMI